MTGGGRRRSRAGMDRLGWCRVIICRFARSCLSMVMGRGQRMTRGGCSFRAKSIGGVVLQHYILRDLIVSLFGSEVEEGAWWLDLGQVSGDTD
jgi:hypothetical protein